MIGTTTLLGHLAKSGTKLNIPQGGDSKVTIPGIIQPTIRIVHPFFSFYSTSQGSLAPVNSWIYSETGTFAATTLVDLMVLGPGLWEITLHMDKQQAGAGSDPTSTHAMIFFALDGTGSSVTLGIISNSQGEIQQRDLKWTQLVTADQTYQFRRSNTFGSGTGTNRFNDIIIATRFF
jgi:hypothetical protein